MHTAVRASLAVLGHTHSAGYHCAGRNRYDIAKELGLAYLRVDYEGDNPAAFVWSKNGQRRHLTESQRAIIGKLMETIKHGDNQHTGEDANLHVLRREDVAKMLNVSPRTIAAAGKVVDHGAPALVAAFHFGYETNS